MTQRGEFDVPHHPSLAELFAESLAVAQESCVGWCFSAILPSAVTTCRTCFELGMGQLNKN